MTDLRLRGRLTATGRRANGLFGEQHATSEPFEVGGRQRRRR